MTITAVKPWIQFACVCEKALREVDNVASLIRIVDTYYIDPQPLPSSIEAASVALPLTIAISLKSGDAVGEHELGLRLTRPNGEMKPIHKWPVRFSGEDETGVTLIMAFALRGPEFGLYRFDVLWGEEVLVRIPLRVKPRVAETADKSTEIATPQ